MVFWAGNFIVVKGAIGVLPPVGFTFLRYCIAALTLLDPACAGARARSGCRAATSSRSSLLGAHRLRLLPDPVAGRAPDDPGRRFGAAHRGDARHDGAAGDGGRGGHAERGQARRRVRLVRRGRAGHRRRPGTRPRRVAGRGRADAARRRVLGGLHGLRRGDPAPPLSARHNDLGARGRDVCMAPVGDRPARDHRPVRRRTRRPVRASSMRASSRPGRQCRRPPGREGPRTDMGDSAAVPRPAARRRHGGHLPGRADPTRSRSSAAR